MNAEQRRKFIRWFCILGPTGLAMGTVSLGVILSAEFARLAPPQLQTFLSIAPLVGWIVFTLACSLILAFDVCRRMEHRDGTRTIALILLTPLIALGHVCTAAAIAFAGCVVVLSGH